MDGLLLVDKPQNITSFGVIEEIRRSWQASSGLKKKDLPKIGHGGTLDPFATGLLVLLVGRAVKRAGDFLGSQKGYAGSFHFGKTTVPGDPTAPFSEMCDHVPDSLLLLREMAQDFCSRLYEQVPPMHSAKRKNGKRLYELARAGITIPREPRVCELFDFEILNYESPRAMFSLRCSSGTYVRTLAQDFGKRLGTLAFLETLHRTDCGKLSVRDALPLVSIQTAFKEGKSLNQLSCWIPLQALDSSSCPFQSTSG